MRNAIESGTYQVGKVRLPSHLTVLGKAPTSTSEPPKWQDTDYTNLPSTRLLSFQFCILRLSDGKIVEYLILQRR